MPNDIRNEPMSGQPERPAAAAHWTEFLETGVGRLSEVLTRKKYIVLILFCIAYGYVTSFRASRKLFWFDELFTVYLSRLPDLVSLWNTLKQGVDFNPPLLYELTRLSQLPFGEGHVASRLPAIIGFGICCLCLFRFVSLRSSPLGGFVSMLFPLVTTAYWYAYEARSHGVVVGFGAVALVCWQGCAMQAERRAWWLLGLGVALACALLTHSYSVLLFLPIILGELARSVSLRRIDWSIWVTVSAAAMAGLISLPLWRAAAANANMVSFRAGQSVLMLADAYQSLLGPAVNIFAGVLVLFCIAEFTARPRLSSPSPVRRPQHYEMVALLVFVAMPVFAFLVSKLASGAPFLHRYCISVVIGFGGLLGFAVAHKPKTALVVLILLVAQIGNDFIQYARLPFMLEPSTGNVLSTNSAAFMRKYTAMAEVKNKNSPIVLLDQFDLPVLYYAPTSLASRFLLAQNKTDVNAIAYLKLRGCCNAAINVVYLSDLLLLHDDFLVYGSPKSAWRLDYFVDAGATLTVVHMSSDAFLISVTLAKKDSPTPTSR